MPINFAVMAGLDLSQSFYGASDDVVITCCDGDRINELAKIQAKAAAADSICEWLAENGIDPASDDTLTGVPSYLLRDLRGDGS